MASGSSKAHSKTVCNLHADIRTQMLDADASFFVSATLRITHFLRRGAVGYTTGDLSPKAGGVIFCYDF